MGKGYGWGHAVLGLLLAVVGGCAHAPASPPEDPAPADTRVVAGGAADPGTGAVQTVRVGRDDPARYATVEEFLAGRVAGLDVIPLGQGRFALRIRGRSSENPSDEPLVVIDGLEVAQDGLSDALTGVVPSDIREVEVLKDGGSTAFYGVRGANGVILITTKRGGDH